jgi:hypothetical protein
MRRSRVQLCGAKLRGKPGRFCRKFALAEHWRCGLHGGLSSGGRPRFDAEGNRIVPNFEALQAGNRRRWERRHRLKAIKATMAAAGMKDEWPLLPAGAPDAQSSSSDSA